MLDRGGGPGLVQAADEGDGYPGDQHGVLAERLEAPPADRRAHDVDRRGQQDVHAFAPGLGAERGGERLDQGGIPGGAERRRAGQAGGRVALVHGDAADPGRAVGYDHGAQPDGGQRAGAPVVRTGQQAHLVVEGERGQQAALVPPSQRDHLVMYGFWLFPFSRPQDAGLRCRITYSSSVGLGPGSEYGLAWLGQPV